MVSTEACSLEIYRLLIMWGCPVSGGDKKNKRHGTWQHANLCKIRLLSDVHNRKGQNANKRRLICAWNFCSIVIPCRTAAEFSPLSEPQSAWRREGQRSSADHAAPTAPPHPPALLRLPQSSGNRVPFPSHIQDGNADWHVNSARQSWRQTSAVSPQQHTALVKSGWKMFLYYRVGKSKTKRKWKGRRESKDLLDKITVSR